MSDVSLGPSVSQIRAATAAATDETAIESDIEQQTAMMSIQKGLEETGNPLVAALKNQDKKLQQRKPVEKSEKSEVGKQAKPLTPKQLNDLADQFCKDNQQFNKKDLIKLLEFIQPNFTKDDILKTVLSQYPSFSDAERALEFLIKTTGGELNTQVEEAKKELYAPINSISPQDTKDKILTKLMDKYPHVVVVDQAISLLLEQSRGALKEQVKLARDELHLNYRSELGTAHLKLSESKQKELVAIGAVRTEEELNAITHDFASNPREATALFFEWDQKFSLKQQETFSSWIHHTTGATLNSKGVHIEPAELHALVSLSKTVQAIQGVYRAANKQIGFMRSHFAHQDLEFPNQLNHESLAKGIMSLITERYPSPEKADLVAQKLAVVDTPSKIIVLNACRDMVPELSPAKIFKTKEHRDEVLGAIIKSSERLEEALEEEEERAASEAQPAKTES